MYNLALEQSLDYNRSSIETAFNQALDYARL